MDYPSFSVKADVYVKLSSLCKLFSTKSLDEYLWVEIPHNLNREFELCCVSKFVSDAVMVSKEVDITASCERIDYKPWIKVSMSALETDSGLHMCKVELVNKYTQQPVTLFFSYIIQTDDPVKPYNYMNTIRETWE